MGYDGPGAAAILLNYGLFPSSLQNLDRLSLSVETIEGRTSRHLSDYALDSIEALKRLRLLHLNDWQDRLLGSYADGRLGHFERLGKLPFQCDRLEQVAISA